jgi:exosome complex component RRP42
MEKILLLSPPANYPLPLLSLTTHLALYTTRLPALLSQGDEDPLFDDDWAAATPLYASTSRPPVTLLVASVGGNAFFDPSGEELAVADSVVAVSVGGSREADSKDQPLQLLSLRTVDPPSRHTPAGVPNSLNTATGGAAPDTAALSLAVREVGAELEPGVWRPPRGGMKRAVLTQITKAAVQKGGVGEEVLEALAGFSG